MRIPSSRLGCFLRPEVTSCSTRIRQNKARSPSEWARTESSQVRSRREKTWWATTWLWITFSGFVAGKDKLARHSSGPSQCNLTSPSGDLLHRLLDLHTLLVLPALHQRPPLSVYQSHKVDGHVAVAVLHGFLESGDDVVKCVNLRTMMIIIYLDWEAGPPLTSSL